MEKAADSNVALKKVRITVIRKADYKDLQERYENVIEHACDLREGQTWLSVDAKRPAGLCPTAWETLEPYVKRLAQGEGDFFDGWMKNPYSAMLSCNDGFRPVSFLIEAM